MITSSWSIKKSQDAKWIWLYSRYSCLRLLLTIKWSEEMVTFIYNKASASGGWVEMPFKQQPLTLLPKGEGFMLAQRTVTLNFLWNIICVQGLTISSYYHSKEYTDNHERDQESKSTPGDRWHLNLCKLKWALLGGRERGRMPSSFSVLRWIF